MKLSKLNVGEVLLLARLFNGELQGDCVNITVDDHAAISTLAAKTYRAREKALKRA